MRAPSNTCGLRQMKMSTRSLLHSMEVNPTGAHGQQLVWVTAAPPEPTEPAVQEDIDQAVNELNDSFTPMFLGLIVAVVIAIVIGIVNFWALRKRK